MHKILGGVAVCLLLAMGMCKIVHGNQPSVWEEFKLNFVNKDGRVIDCYNGYVSHSEGQGYGMLLAVKYNDKAAFDKLWQWTQDNIAVRNDDLFAWKWGERTSGVWGVVDYNNATDGDILIASALLKADEQWPNNNYKNTALRIIKSVRENLAIEWNGCQLLLPGHHGFIRENRFIVNPSYIIFSAYRAFAKIDDEAFWQKVYKDSMLLVAKSCFGTLKMPADWVMLDGKDVSICYERKPYFGYEAIRVFLYLSWEENPQFPEGLEKMLDIYNKLGFIPLWVDLANDSISLQNSPPGFYAVFARAAERIGEKMLSKKLFKEAGERLMYDKKDYYSFCLYLLAEE
ncbi:MAG: endoglucanase [Planctomycetes bacterium]|nr:endoglucanase [Planctomycetota bacterium]